MSETLTVRYYEADDGSVIFPDPEEDTGTGLLIEPVLLDGFTWRYEADCRFKLPRPRGKEKVYRRQQVDIHCTALSRPVFEQHPEAIQRMIERRVRRSVINQVRASLL